MNGRKKILLSITATCWTVVPRGTGSLMVRPSVRLGTKILCSLLCFYVEKYCACMKHLEKCIERKTRSPMCQVMVILGFGKGVLSVKIRGTKSGYSSGVRSECIKSWKETCFRRTAKIDSRVYREVRLFVSTSQRGDEWEKSATW